VINGQTFVNNASFGAYAEVVETPAYRGDKLNTTLNTLPDLLQGHRGAHLHVRADGTRSRRRRRCWWPTIRTEPGTWLAWAAARSWIAASSGVVGVKVDSARPAARSPPLAGMP
jgi:hypothetical protein